MEDVLWQIERVRTKKQFFLGAALSATAAYLLRDELVPHGSTLVASLFVIALITVGVIYSIPQRRHAITLSSAKLTVDGATYNLKAIESVRFRWLLEPMVIIDSGGLKEGHSIGWLTKNERAELEALLQRQIAANK